MNVFIIHFSGQLGIKDSGGYHKVERNRLYVFLPKNEDIYLIRGNILHILLCVLYTCKFYSNQIRLLFELSFKTCLYLNSILYIYNIVNNLKT